MGNPTIYRVPVEAYQLRFEIHTLEMKTPFNSPMKPRTYQTVAVRVLVV